MTPTHLIGFKRNLGSKTAGNSVTSDISVEDLDKLLSSHIILAVFFFSHIFHVISSDKGINIV